MSGPADAIDVSNVASWLNQTPVWSPLWRAELLHLRIWSPNARSSFSTPGEPKSRGPKVPASGVWLVRHRTQQKPPNIGRHCVPARIGVAVSWGYFGSVSLLSRVFRCCCWVFVRWDCLAVRHQDRTAACRSETTAEVDFVLPLHSLQYVDELATLLAGMAEFTTLCSTQINAELAPLRRRSSGLIGIGANGARWWIVSGWPFFFVPGLARYSAVRKKIHPHTFIRRIFCLANYGVEGDLWC